MANKITTLSYFVKRLKDSGYVVYKMFDEYSEADPRNWTVLIDPGNASNIVLVMSIIRICLEKLFLSFMTEDSIYLNGLS